MPACFVCKREFSTVHEFNDHVCSGPPVDHSLDDQQESSFSEIAGPLSWKLPLFGMAINVALKIGRPEHFVALLMAVVVIAFFAIGFILAIIGIFGSLGEGKRRARARSSAYVGFIICGLAIGWLIFGFYFHGGMR